MPMATADNTAFTLNKATPGYIASELSGIKQGFEILREYVSEGGPQDHKNWLIETLYQMIERAEQHAEELDSSERHPATAV